MKSYIGSGVQLSDPYHTGSPVEVQQIDDGRWHHKISQSWAKTFDICPERARLEHDGYSKETDAACVGTAVHSGIEYALELWHDGQAVNLQEILDLAVMHLESMEFEWVKWTTMRGPIAFLKACLTHWFDLVLPSLPRSGGLEYRFKLPLIDDDQRLVEVSGTIDYLGAVMRDWKTSGRGPYEEWEYRRWALQPTFYTWAANELGLVAPNENGYVPFEYVVMHRHGVQRFTVHRGPQEWAWMRDKVLTMCLLIEADLPEWPKQDNHALCSAKWCAAWDVCKGKFIT